MVAAVKKARVVNMVCHNYRRIPAIALAKRMIEDGAIGDRIFHYRARYAQDWITDPEFPARLAAAVENRRLRRPWRHQRPHHRPGPLPRRRNQGSLRPHGDLHQGAPAPQQTGSGLTAEGWKENGQSHRG